MAGTKYSVTPLKGEKSVLGAEGYAVRGFPSNFLIDRDGRIVFTNFRADEPHGEAVLQRMIKALLARPGALETPGSSPAPAFRAYAAN